MDRKRTCVPKTSGWRRADRERLSTNCLEERPLWAHFVMALRRHCWREVIAHPSAGHPEIDTLSRDAVVHTAIIWTDTCPCLYMSD